MSKSDHNPFDFDINVKSMCERKPKNITMQGLYSLSC